MFVPFLGLISFLLNLCLWIVDEPIDEQELDPELNEYWEQPSDVAKVVPTTELN